MLQVKVFIVSMKGYIYYHYEMKGVEGEKGRSMTSRFRIDTDADWILQRAGVGLCMKAVMHPGTYTHIHTYICSQSTCIFDQKVFPWMCYLSWFTVGLCRKFFGAR